MTYWKSILLLITLLVVSCKDDDADEKKVFPNPLEVKSIRINGQEVLSSGRITDIPPSKINLEVHFTIPIIGSTINNQNVKIIDATKGEIKTNITVTQPNVIAVSSVEKLSDFSKYTFFLAEGIAGEGGGTLRQTEKIFYTGRDEENDFPLISDEDLQTLVQKQTFKYFWDFAHPVSGMARERNTSGDIVTTGGTGFGLTIILVGIERNFISRHEGIERISKIVDFLSQADRFHGAWPHWMNGSTGNVIPFSPDDDGGDLVETSFLVQGLLTVRQYLNPADARENEIITSINSLWESIEWDWYTKGEDVLYWHWSPRAEWKMNHQIRGHNETLITYVLAASSPTHPIEASVYHNGYARNGAIKNGKSFYNMVLPLGEDYGGPLFFTHYSFLGLDPRNLKDTYADYWLQNVNHTLINRAYAIDNPKNFVGYSEESWGLTASDNHQGYSAHSPLNDLGVITPTAALSSFPYTPNESMQALKFFYYTIGDKLWGEYGFYDAYNITEGWIADSYLAIDQGPIIVMIENYRSALLWNLFMSNEEVQDGLQKLSFTF